MKRKLLVAGLLALCGIAAAQKPPSSKSEEPNKQWQAQINTLQWKIDRLERELDFSLAQWEKSNLPRFQPRRAILLNVYGETIVIGCAKNGIRVGDTFLIVRPTDKGRIIAGKGRVHRAFTTDAEAAIIENYTSVRPEDEIYVLNRSSSPHSLRWAQFETEQKP
jgi:hypothetical protein